MFFRFAFALQTVGFRFTLCFQSFGFLITFTSGYFFIFYPKSMKTKTPRSRYTCEVSVFCHLAKRFFKAVFTISQVRSPVTTGG